jgi:hypothetical protein
MARRGALSLLEVVKNFLSGQKTKDDALEVFAGGVCYFYERFAKGDKIMDVLAEVQGKEGVFVDGGGTDAKAVAGR